MQEFAHTENNFTRFKMKCKLADKAFFMAVENNILTKEENAVKETIKNYAEAELSPKAKITLTYLILEIEKGIKEDKNG